MQLAACKVLLPSLHCSMSTLSLRDRCGHRRARWGRRDGLANPMTAVPQRTALSSLGALAACLVGVAEFVQFEDMDRVSRPR
jgi:hypothetical protein